ncbi:MAG: hypothetical protein ACI9BO_002137 [Zhongshania sp.]|jgi:hypothetical protein
MNAIAPQQRLIRWPKMALLYVAEEAAEIIILSHYKRRIASVIREIDEMIISGIVSQDRNYSLC